MTLPQTQPLSQRLTLEFDVTHERLRPRCYHFPLRMLVLSEKGSRPDGVLWSLQAKPFVILTLTLALALTLRLPYPHH